MNESDDYKRGWYDGYQAGKNSQYQPVTQPINNQNICKVCGIDFGNKAWGYVCYNAKCPNGISCYRSLTSTTMADQ